MAQKIRENKLLFIAWIILLVGVAILALVTLLDLINDIMIIIDSTDVEEDSLYLVGTLCKNLIGLVFVTAPAVLVTFVFFKKKPEPVEVEAK